VETGNYDDAIKALEPVWAASPDSPILANAVLVAARANLQKGNPAGAVSLLRSFATRLPQPRAEAILAKSLEANNEPQAAAASWQHVYYDYPTAPESADAAAALTRLRGTLGSSFPAPTPSMMLGRVGRMTDGKQFASARKELEGLIPSLTAGDRDVARVRLGSIDYQSGEYSDALRYLKMVQVDDPDAEAERLYYMAAVYRRLDNDEEFNRTLDQLNHHSKSRWRLQALVLAGNRYMLQNDPEKYERYFKAGYENFPDQPDGAYCHWRVAWWKYLQRHGDAEEYLRKHLKTFPSSEKAPAALYFLGRLAESKNKPNAARTWYNELVSRFPNAYYGMIGRDRLTALPRATGGPTVTYTDEDGNSTKVASGIDNGVAKFLQEVEWPARNQNLAFESTPAIKHRLERAALLQSAGLDDLAENELRYGAKNEGPAPLLAMELAASATRRGSPDQGIRFIKGLCPDYMYVPVDAAPAAFWRLAFPLPYRNELETNSRQNDLDPYSVAALIRQESEFNPRALSYANAHGLTQVMPATGRYLSKRVGMKRFSPSMLWRPDVNLKLGTYYLRSLLSSFNGRWEPALASYNAGKSRVDMWLTWADYKEPAEFVENIPIAQTRDYVQIVMRNADVYRKLYGASAAAVNSTNGSAARNRSEP
jgi:soluble lytic murein transglycosylase